MVIGCFLFKRTLIDPLRRPISTVAHMLCRPSSCASNVVIKVEFSRPEHTKPSLIFIHPSSLGSKYRVERLSLGIIFSFLKSILILTALLKKFLI